MKAALAGCGAGSPELPPLSLAEAAGCLLHANHEAAALDLDAGPAAALTPERRARELLCAEPRAVLLVVEPGGEAKAFETAEAVKALEPSAGVVLLGPALRDEAAAEAALDSCPADAVIRGAFDDVLPKLAGLFDAAGKWMALPGVWTRQARGPKPVPFSFDLDLAPFADFSWVEPSFYARPDTMPIEGSRGCASACDFCAAREAAGKRSFKSGDRIFTDAGRGLRQQPSWRRLAFADIDANGNPESLRRFAAMAADEGWPARGVRWSFCGSIRPEMEASLLAALVAGGCDRIVYGLETASDRLRAKMGKPWPLALAEGVLALTREAGIAAEVSLIAGHPDETDADFEATRSWVASGAGGADAVRARPASVQAPSRLWLGNKVPHPAAPERAASLLAALPRREAAAA